MNANFVPVKPRKQIRQIIKTASIVPRNFVVDAAENYAKIPKGMNIITNTMETWEKRHRLEFGPCLQLTVKVVNANYYGLGIGACV